MRLLIAALPALSMACATPPPPAPPAAVPPVAARPFADVPTLAGRWTIGAVDGRPAAGAWLEFGGEGLGTVTETEQGIFVGSPEPRTSAFLGCNTWHLNGWSRSAGILTLGINMSVMTERGCAEAVMAIEDAAHAILREPLGMTFATPDRLMLHNALGTVALARSTMP